MNGTMTDRESLIRAICETPDDDVPRLVFADWLEEHGEAERAGFIRLQCEIAEWFDPHEQAPRLEPLREREIELFGRLFVAGAWDHLPGSRIALGHGTRIRTSDGWEYGVHRGFVSAVRCRLADWVGSGECEECRGTRDYLHPTHYRQPCKACKGTGRTPGHGPAIVAAHPVERVEIVDATWTPTDRGNSFNPGRMSYLSLPSVGRSVVDPKILVLHPTEASARDMLSAWLINWARRESGLPPIS